MKNSLNELFSFLALCLEFVKEDTEFGPVVSVSFNIE